MQCEANGDCCSDYDDLCSVSLDLHLYVDNVEQVWFLYGLDDFKDLLAQHFKIQSKRIHIYSPSPDAARRVLTARSISFTVYAADNNQAMQVQNNLGDMTWMSLLQSDARRQLKDWTTCKITAPTGTKRSNCQYTTGTVGEGIILSNTKAEDLDACTLDCIERVSCVGYNFDPNGSVKCSLLSDVVARQDSRFSASVSGLCLPMDKNPSTIEHKNVDGQAITVEDDEASGDNNEDSSDSALIAIILTVLVLVIMFSLMTYCAYVYGKNKRMSEESKSAPDDFPISAHQLNSADIIAEQRLFEQAVTANNYENNKRSMEHSGAIQVLQDPSTETGSRKMNSLDYLASQPPITSTLTSTPSGPPPKPQPSNPLSEPATSSPPSYIMSYDHDTLQSNDKKEVDLDAETKGGSIYDEEETP